MLDLKTYRPQGDKRNTPFFEEVLPRVYERRRNSGIDQLVGMMAALLLQVQHGDAMTAMAELTLMGPYRFQECWLTETHRIYLLRSQPDWPRLILMEPLTQEYEDELTRWNALYPLAAPKANTRYVGEIYYTTSCRELRTVLESQSIRFVYPGETSNSFYAQPRLTCTRMSDYTYNRVGYVEVPLDSLEPLDLGDRVLLDDELLDRLEQAARKHALHGLEGVVLGVDHLASRVLAGEREDAILEYLTMVPYYFWGAYDITAMNSSTNVTRCPLVEDEKQSPAKVFTANNTPSYLNSFNNLPMPTEDFVRNYGRRLHHIAYEVKDGASHGLSNVDFVVQILRDLGIAFLADVVGECNDQPNLRQIFSRHSASTLLISEYVQRCHGYAGFFTHENVAALTEAAGQDERYEHGHVFD